MLRASVVITLSARHVFDEREKESESSLSLSLFLLFLHPKGKALQARTDFQKALKVYSIALGAHALREESTGLAL